MHPRDAETFLSAMDQMYSTFHYKVNRVEKFFRRERPRKTLHSSTIGSMRRENSRVAGRDCHHCKKWIEPGEAHDCWTTTEDALTRHLPGDLREAWQRIRETAAAFGPQRIYASGSAIMFSRRTCYFFVRPKKQQLDVYVFLGRTIKAPQVHRVEEVSKTKVGHVVRITHRDQVEAPLTNWLQEAYEVSETLSKGSVGAKPRLKSARPAD